MNHTTSQGSLFTLNLYIYIHFFQQAHFIIAEIQDHRVSLEVDVLLKDILTELLFTRGL